ncbi:alpha/beta hydrolase [Pseudoalteromonas sp. APM04]|uniref:alpha/beta fold hydrolase n=1 Tax=Pseudoalteromonas sp. APM04 TaxID=2699396 RepID=UPI001FB2752F|nr:alpha/beta hydrolase [Pseudoalteromonas sp. APM04]UOB75373.1 alpha/beta hydrolase [Pseudoalteromonas sp. APM04]
MLNSETIKSRNNVKIIGSGPKTLLFGHGFGCDQNMWRFLTPYLDTQFRVVLFDYVGSGNSDISQYDKQRYKKLEGYALDVIEVCTALELFDVVFVGHSVSSMIGALAAFERPDLISKLIMVCPSPCFLNFPPDYQGGFDKEDLQELLSLMDKNYIGWADYLAPLVVGNANSAELIGELSGSFCSTDPVIAKNFAEATFFSDYRFLLKKIKQPTLILQSQDDALADVSVGEFVKQEIETSSLIVIAAQGHCLQMTHPEIVSESIINYMQ